MDKKWVMGIRPRQGFTCFLWLTITADIPTFHSEAARLDRHYGRIPRVRLPLLQRAYASPFLFAIHKDNREFLAALALLRSQFLFRFFTHDGQDKQFLF